MRNILTLSIVATMLPLFFGAASVHAMRCGTDLITETSSKFEVIRACGEPLAKYGDDVDIGEEGLDTGGYEKWIYDIGGGVFHVVYFHGNEVWKIEIEQK